jgi:hypothetical protein
MVAAATTSGGQHRLRQYREFFTLSAEAENRKSVYRFVPTAMGACFLNEANCQAVNPDFYNWFDAVDPERASSRIRNSRT